MRDVNGGKRWEITNETRERRRSSEGWFGWVNGDSAFKIVRVWKICN